jgi:hypothetical protein
LRKICYLFAYLLIKIVVKNEDFTKIPGALDKKFEKFDDDNSVCATTLTPSIIHTIFKDGVWS